MNNLVQFNNSQLKVIESNNQYCLTATDIAKALGFEKVKSVSNIYTRHADEFEGLSWVINLMTETQSYHNRVFNREGAWLIGMFSRTPKAAEFRKWVLKVLGAVVDSSPNDAKQIEVAAHTRSLPSGKKEIVLSEKAKTEIGGIVKNCAAVAVREELAKAYDYDDALNNPQNIMQQLNAWFQYHHSKLIGDYEKLNYDYQILKLKLENIQKAIDA